LRDWLVHTPAADASLEAFHQYAAAEIKRFADDPKKVNVPRPPTAPPGMPIGDDEADFFVW
jgi:hypothetical protein